MFNSRRNGDNIPSAIANLADNTDARPTLTASEQNEISSQQSAIDGNITMITAREQLADDQAAWDESYGATHNPDGSPKDPNAEGIAGRQLTADDTLTWLPNGERPTEELATADPADDPYNFTGARGAVSGNQRIIDEIRKDLADNQKDWDNQYAETHNTDGVAKLNPRFTDSKIAKAQDQVAIDNQKAADDAMGPRDATFGDPQPQDQEGGVGGQDGELADITPITPADITTPEEKPKEKVVPPVTVTTNPNDSLSRKHIIANTKIAIANGDMQQASVVAMLENLETTYPGISQEIMPDGIDSYKQNPNAQIKKIQDDTKEEYKPEDVNRNGKPPQGALSLIHI